MVWAMNSMSVRVGRPAIPARKYSKHVPFVVITLLASMCIHWPQGTNSRKNAAALQVSPDRNELQPITFSQRGIRPLILTGKRNAAMALQAATTTAAPVMSPRITYNFSFRFKQRPPQSRNHSNE
ncbi:hypothetical protein GQX74_011173 [Glossina fuscipes]|nr:hypothetical protein GQX74_011173 [Glossina fuscipes]